MIASLLVFDDVNFGDGNGSEGGSGNGSGNGNGNEWAGLDVWMH